MRTYKEIVKNYILIFCKIDNLIFEISTQINNLSEYDKNSIFVHIDIAFSDYHVKSKMLSELYEKIYLYIKLIIK